MRREENFQELMKKKKIIIPIIQRDYAQGRNNPKAKSVRTRLIDEWIDILQNSDLRMDFNYIYGNEGEDIFYPVDGQQRLTSLYLLHWYLAMATHNSDEISNWQFDYKTRNSASEFFSFLRNAKKSERLFEILYQDNAEEQKQYNIRNENWFKTKWDNDPTIVACINFLCMLSEKLSKHENKLDTFWNRLKDSSCPAVYFTCLKECDDSANAEVNAAKKYTRMNARGKRLTNFENLKAMIDEIEMKHITNLLYCSDDEQKALSDTISWTYDRTYIDCMFNSIQESTLIEKTKAINEESDKWFRLVYYVYALVNERPIPGDFNLDPKNKTENYEDIIYKISQGRVVDEKIPQYLYMLKAVFEVICNSKTELTFKYKDFNISERTKRIYAIAFVLFVSQTWDKNNRKEDNEIIATNWNQFRNAITDLGFDGWAVSEEKELADIIFRMIEGIKKNSNISVNEYFVNNDFETNSPFASFELTNDLKCRIIERKIKSKLILNDAATETDIDKVPIGNKRWGYLYYICGYLKNWDLGDWSGKPKWDGIKLRSYINLIKDTDSFRQMMCTRAAKVVFAYASQYDFDSKSLLSTSDINFCNNDHIWNPLYLEWTDSEYGNIAENKLKLLNHLKVMFDLLLDFCASSDTSEEELIEKYVQEINKFFENTAGYEQCWLRFAAKYPTGGKELLDSKLENENGVVKIRSVPVILKTYLRENGYSYIDKISKLKDFDKKSNYFTDDENKIMFASTDKTCTFAPDASNSGKYRHSSPKDMSSNWDLSGNVVNRNMDLFYRAFFNLSRIGMDIKNNFWSIDVEGETYIINIYEISGIKNGKLTVNISKAKIDANSITQVKANILQWKKRFDEIEKEPEKTGSYDHWIELWNDKFQNTFKSLESSFVPGTVTYEQKGGQRPRKIWSEVIAVPSLNWSMSSIEI